jgi:TatD DNase family protein
VATFYDTHAHLDYPDFGQEVSEVVDRARSAGISHIISIGTSIASSEQALAIADSFANVYAAVGCHPSDAAEAPEDIRPALRKLAAHPKVVALGETGLDYYRMPGKQDPARMCEDEPYKTRQKELFQQHLEVAAELGLNCVIHQRESFEDTLAILEPFATQVRGVFHCFSNDIQCMRRVLALGSIISFTGIVTFKNAALIRETLAATPLDQFMLETDSPFLAPLPYRGKRCEPAYVKQTADVVATVKQCSLEALGAATCATAEKFFRNFPGS